jgi:hypothetical protein
MTTSYGVTIQGKQMITWEIIKNDKPWVARCPSLKLTAEGATWEDLCETVREIVYDYFGHDEPVSWEKCLRTSYADVGVKM